MDANHGTGPRRNLAGLFEMVAGLADAALDGNPDSDPAGARPDPQAAELIDVLIVLWKRTEGHRTPEETQILDGLIDALQRRYVQVTSRS